MNGKLTVLANGKRLNRKMTNLLSILWKCVITSLLVELTARRFADTRNLIHRSLYIFELVCVTLWIWRL